MAEALDLTTPIALGTITTYKVTFFSFDKKNQKLSVRIETTTGSPSAARDFVYTDTDAMTRMAQLNKANGTIKTLERRILETLAAEHPELAGSISGAPD